MLMELLLRVNIRFPLVDLDRIQERSLRGSTYNSTLNTTLSKDGKPKSTQTAESPHVWKRSVAHFKNRSGKLVCSPVRGKTTGMPSVDYRDTSLMSS